MKLAFRNDFLLSEDIDRWVWSVKRLFLLMSGMRWHLALFFIMYITVDILLAVAFILGMYLLTRIYDKDFQGC